MENIDVIYENFPPEKFKSQVHFQKTSQTSRCAVVCLGSLCALLLAGNIALIVIYQLQANSDCEIGWTKFNGSCYIVSSNKKTWEESRNDCKDRGADLVTIKSKEEQAFVNGLLRSRERAWIGFNQQLSKEWDWKWEWVDATPVITTFWQPKEYSRYMGSGLNCGELTQTSSNGYWTDEFCSSSKVWICEKNNTNKL